MKYVIELTSGTAGSPYPVFIDVDKIVWINPVVSQGGEDIGTQIRCSDGGGIIVRENVDTVLTLWTKSK